MKLCMMPDCTSKHKAKGLCVNHYAQQKSQRLRDAGIDSLWVAEADRDDFWLFVKKEMGIK